MPGTLGLKFPIVCLCLRCGPERSELIAPPATKVVGQSLVILLLFAGAAAASKSLP